MKQKFLDNQMVEGGINRYSEKYDVGKDVKYIGNKNTLGKIAGCAVIGIGLVGLMLITGTPDEDSVEEQECIKQAQFSNLFMKIV